MCDNFSLFSLQFINLKHLLRSYATAMFHVVIELNVLMCSSTFYAIDLLKAAESNELDKYVKFLNKHNVNTCDDRGISLLMWLSCNGNQPMCEILLKKGALVDKHDHEGITPLIIAAFYGHLQICNLLLENNASVNHEANAGRTAPLVGPESGHVDVCTLLLKNNELANHRNKNGVSPQYVAA